MNHPLATTHSHSDILTKPAEDLAMTWQVVSAEMQSQCGLANFKDWIQPLSFKEIDGGEIILTAPTRFIREWVVTHYSERLLALFKQHINHIYALHIRVEQPTNISNASQLQAVLSAPVATPEFDSRPSHQEVINLSQNLDARFSFDRFIVGPSNELAYAAAKNVAEAGDVVPGVNPLFIYGGVGLGKTHLMHAMANRINELDPSRRVVYMSAEKFMYQFIRALKNKDVVAFKEIFRSVDVLMIDDIQFICGKTSTQEEFFHTFNALVDEGKQLILSGDRSPSDMEGMEERIRSRLGWGLVVDINSTTYELRLGILQSKAEYQNLHIPQDVLGFLATKITSNIRELEGALNKVIAHSRFIQKPITVESTQDILRDLLRSNNKAITVEDIKEKVANHYNIKLSDMNSARRARQIARPRQIAMYLSKKMTPLSLPEIGRKFGGKDHTTVMHAVKRIEALSSEEPEIAEDIRLLTRSLEN